MRSKLTTLLLCLFCLGVQTLSADPEHQILIPPPGYATQQEGEKAYSEAFSRAIKLIKMNRIYGDIAEFGTFRDFTARIIAMLMRSEGYPAHLHLFDSFEGLPPITSNVDYACDEVAVDGVWYDGAMAVAPQTPQLIRNVLHTVMNPSYLHIHEGYFEQTLSRNLFSRKLALVHIDCDLYQSAKFVLSYLLKNDLVEDGAVLLFDDYNCCRANPKFGERRALAEVLQENPQYACSLFYYYSWHGACFILHKMN